MRRSQDHDVKKHFSDKPPFLAWLRWSRHEGAQEDPGEAVEYIHRKIKAAMEMDDARGTTGAWVSLLGFSQGAKLAACLLYTRQHCLQVLGRKPSHYLPNFHFAVLIAGRSPLVWLDDDPEVPRGLISAGTLSRAVPTSFESIPIDERLSVPTLHVHGLRDPGLAMYREMLEQCCDESSLRVMEWEGAHQVPIKTSDVATLAQTILSLAKRSGSIEVIL
ncbi:hypothetical protein LTR56_027475 [Elasticomyces elasticus]|nr:hypothetical protein LTR56_027475 [Elasticomyces elasticus]KAK3616782.1 hypothetical protein LTR22_026956 [Elasticomyces elasticus]KAK4897061.1 hypothetical protein LTR49_028046 [Elasticomyces elasticus]KAK5736381.1 hypothetical protein LTS12_026196 [Elasticomyces elasticus]